MLRNREYITHDEAGRRFPRLLRAMRWASCLSSLEAECALVMHLAGHEWAGEAVNHGGGCKHVIRHAIRCRHVTRRVAA